MSEEQFQNIDEALSVIPDQFIILEEVVDIEIQKEFFDASQDLEFDVEKEPVEELANILIDDTASIEDKKLALIKLASIDLVESFRIIEKFAADASSEIREWSLLAMQQSKMIIQSSLLGEQQVFISTGLGGRKNKLRYFLIFPFVEGKIITRTQSDLLASELNFYMGKSEAEVESIEMSEKFFTAMVLIPIKTAISDLIQDIVDECNQYGDFLSEDAMITNVKKLNDEEISELLNDYNEQKD